MSKVYGIVVDGDTQKAIAGASVMLQNNETPAEGATTSLDGSFVIDNIASDGNNPNVSVDATGYHNAIVNWGSSGDQNLGTIGIYKIETTTNKIPVWVWAIVGVAAIAVLYFAFFKNKK